MAAEIAELSALICTGVGYVGIVGMQITSRFPFTFVPPCGYRGIRSVTVYRKHPAKAAGVASVAQAAARSGGGCAFQFHGSSSVILLAG